MRLLILLVFGFSISLRAQDPLKKTYKVSGRVVDSVSKTPLDYATVNLKSGDNKPVKVALTALDGSFYFSEVPMDAYSISVASLGYATKLVKFKLGDRLKHDLGTIGLGQSTNNLKEISITAERPVIKQEVDRLTYDLQADPESKVSNVLEMMRKVPLLTVDADDNILLKGNASYKILINGKPSSMVERNPKDILRSMPASSIEKIEVITTPPAKYDGEGLTGIINIITNKKIADGYNASLNFNTRFPVGGPGIGTSFTVKAGKFGVSGYGGGNLHNSPATVSSNSRITSGINSTRLVQNGRRESESMNGYFGADLSFELDTLNLISGQININGNQSDGIHNQLSLLNQREVLLQRYDLTNNNEGSGDGFDAALNYQLGFKADKNRLLTISYRYYGFSFGQFNTLDASNTLNFNTPGYKQNNKSSSSEQTFQVDYVHPVKKFTIEAGVKGILRTNKSDFQYQSFNSQSQLYEIDPERTNNFNNTQNVFGAYNTYQYNMKDWGFKAGIRLEQTIIDADFISGGTQVEKEYLNLIPSVSINRKFKDMSSLNFGYTTRMQRPSIYRLNPFVDRSNPSFVTKGNPNLRPTIGNLLQLNYSKAKKGSLNVGLNYMFIDDLIMPFSTLDPVTNTTITTYDNTGKAQLAGFEINFNYPITKRWNYSLNGRLNYGWVEGIVDNVLVKNEGLMSGMHTSTGYKFEKGWAINASLNYNGRNISLQGRSNDFFGTSFSLNKEIKGKLTLSAAANNPFDKYMEMVYLTEGIDFIQESYNQNYLRSFTLSLNYRFGSLKEGIKKNKRGIRNDDVSGAGAGNGM